MEKLPLYIFILFGFTTLLTLLLFYRATQKSFLTAGLVLLWVMVQSLIALTGFYTITDTLPPRFMLLLFLPLLLIVMLFTTRRGMQFIRGLDPARLTLLHVVRIPVEIVLLALFTQGTIPGIMTFEGWNFDIMSGLTAPLVYYFGFVKKQLSNRVIIAWNILCMGLLFNIVTIAVLSVPFPFQQLAFDQPNMAVLYFPFIWLPCFIVPIVLFSHLATIFQLVRQPSAIYLGHSD